ncbi:MAG: hypothetical protein R2694_06390 [Ilumatobacteraceae bacterium]|nr:hypothetical protein [Ilumatobacter sp.]MCB0983597.1 hypothetical protein [Ilumatobacter sp.]
MIVPCPATSTGYETGPDATVRASAIAPGTQVRGIYDLAEERHFRRALGGADRGGLERAGFFVCVADLEDVGCGAGHHNSRLKLAGGLP